VEGADIEPFYLPHRVAKKVKCKVKALGLSTEHVPVGGPSSPGRVKGA
jgi:hypothetical protein